MKETLDRICMAIGQLWSYFCPTLIPKAFCTLRDRLYTGYLRRHFANFGQSVFCWHLYHLKGCRFISIGDDNVFESGLQLTAWNTGSQQPCIMIGNHCTIRRNNHITAVGHITIGDHLLTGDNVLISDNSHGDTDYDTLHTAPAKRNVVTKGPVVIGNNVWLGNNVCVLSGVTIGDGAVIGANSVVTHDIPPYCIAAGIPAKVVKESNPERITKKTDNNV